MGRVQPVVHHGHGDPLALDALRPGGLDADVRVVRAVEVPLARIQGVVDLRIVQRAALGFALLRVLGVLLILVGVDGVGHGTRRQLGGSGHPEVVRARAEVVQNPEAVPEPQAESYYQAKDIRGDLPALGVQQVGADGRQVPGPGLDDRVRRLGEVQPEVVRVLCGVDRTPGGRSQDQARRRVCGAARVRHRLGVHGVIPRLPLEAGDNHVVDARGHAAPHAEVADAARQEAVVTECQQGPVAVVQAADRIVLAGRVRPDVRGAGRARKVDLEDVVIVAVLDASRHRRPQRQGRGRGEGVPVVVGRLGRGGPRAQPRAQPRAHDETEGDQQE